MRLATIRTGDGTHAARVEGDTLVELDYADVGALLRSGADALARAAGTEHVTGAEHALDGADFATLVLDPGKIVCVGVNYADHIAEMGREPPEFPTLFAKYTDALVGARDDIWLPRVSDMVDWEVELTVVIGHTVRHASPDDAARRDRRLHHRQRHLDARLAEPHGRSGSRARPSSTPRRSARGWSPPTRWAAPRPTWSSRARSTACSASTAARRS